MKPGVLPSLFSCSGLLWLWACFFIRVHLWWNEASYYTYGWAVPLFCGLLWFRRAGVLQGHGEKEQGTGSESGLLPLFGLLIG